MTGIFENINHILLYFFAVSLIIAFRYLITAGFFFYHFYIKNSLAYRDKRLSKRDFKKTQFQKEIKWSLISSIIFAIPGVLLYYLYNMGFTKIYFNFTSEDFWYVPLSLISVLLLHETYYYWVHRWMHLPRVYKKVHKVHHDSLTPSPWTAFSFHPWEASIQAIIFPIIVIFLPLHIAIVLFYLIFMTLSSVINHLDIEIYPEKFQQSCFGKNIIGATHHHYHHSEFNTNYGLYFTFWDRWMKTESSQQHH